MGRRNKQPATPEQLEARKQARRQADQALRENAQAVLDDEHRLAAMDTSLTSASERIRNYSDRNRALLYTQAQERGIKLSEVATFKQWREHGRQVRKGEKSLRITAPKGTEERRDADEETGDKGMRPEGEDGQQQQPAEEKRFRMIAVFDRSQTDELDEADAVDTRDAAGRFAGANW